MIWLLFAIIQLVNLPLMILGWFVCLSPNFAHFTWLWWNDDDGAVGSTWWAKYVWLAWRNPVANLRHVPGVSKAGRPLWYGTRTIRGKEFYWKFGWMSDGYPACSLGAGRGY
jgi:uncharacterized membrane-anchored protein YitT (DUF2179 family)